LGYVQELWALGRYGGQGVAQHGVAERAGCAHGFRAGGGQFARTGVADSLAFFFT
jgi:hypothetical protein